MGLGPGPATNSSPPIKRLASAGRFFRKRGVILKRQDEVHPHFEYPQLKQVAHPSMMIVAFVLHFRHMVAPGG